MSEKQQRDEIRILCSASRRFGISMRVCAFCRIFTRTIILYYLLIIIRRLSNTKTDRRAVLHITYSVQTQYLLYMHICVCVCNCSSICHTNIRLHNDIIVVLTHSAFGGAFFELVFWTSLPHASTHYCYYRYNIILYLGPTHRYTHTHTHASFSYTL